MGIGISNYRGWEVSQSAFCKLETPKACGVIQYESKRQRTRDQSSRGKMSQYKRRPWGSSCTLSNSIFTLRFGLGWEWGTAQCLTIPTSCPLANALLLGPVNMLIYMSKTACRCDSIKNLEMGRLVWFNVPSIIINILTGANRRVTKAGDFWGWK